VAGNTATVAIGVSAHPVNASQLVMTTVGTGLPITLTASEPDGNSPVFTLVAPPANGTLSGAAPALTYTPDAGFSGQDLFTFTSTDGPAAGNIAVVGILVAAPPVNADQSLAAATGVALPITLTASEPDGDTPGYTIVTPPAHGTLAGNAPVLTYTSATGYFGPDRFTFTSSDGPATGNTATVSIVVKAAPVDSGQSVVAAAGVALPITLTASEPDGDTPAFQIVAPPSHGTLSGTGADLTYTASADYIGPDSFTFASNDGPAVGNTATVAITVKAPPVDAAQSLTTAAGAALPTTVNVPPPGPPAAQPEVIVKSVWLQKVPAGRHKSATVIVVQYSASVNPPDAQNLGDYSLTKPPGGKKHSSSGVSLVRAVYDASASAVSLTPKRPLLRNRPIILSINTSGVHDTSGRPIAGNDGQPGSRFTATLSKGRVSIARVRP
jgi:hypothetical protein